MTEAGLRYDIYDTAPDRIILCIFEQEQTLVDMITYAAGLEESQLRSPIDEPYGGNRDRSLTERIIAYIEENYATELSLRDVARTFGYSACHLTHTFARSTGTPITAWIIKRRILAAQRLLGEANVDVATACEAVGFNDLCYFTRQFVRHVGLTPGRFRSAMRDRRRAKEDCASQLS